MSEPATRRWQRLPSPGVLVLAALTYLPALTAKPGRMPTDTKLFLYLDPGRLVADAPFTWDTRQFAGWVPHQTIAYLWPSGPWFWCFDRLGVPDWVAHRLWIGTLLFLGGLGVRWAAKQLGLAPGAAAVAGIVYALSPYILPYVSRTSVMLLPWGGLGWLIGLTVRATTRTRWRDVGLFGLVVLTIGAVNAAALALVAPGPVLWLIHTAWQRSITWRTALLTAIKLGSVSVVVSLWWMVMLVVQGRHGADVLAFSETLDAVSLTSVSTETLRGLGYWLFYVRDPYAFTTTAAIDHLGSTKVILAGYALTVVCLLGLAVVRWSQRRFAAWMVFAGIVLAVGVHPIDSPSPLMAPLRDSALGLALRSSTRALPLSGFGLALGAGALVTMAGHLGHRRAQSAPHGRLATLSASARMNAGVIAAIVIVALAVVGLPAATSGGYVDPALERDQDVPAAWSEAVAALDAGSTEHRVLQLPGSEFGAFRWGYTVDPPLPGLTDKPLVTRDLLPLGSPGAMDLLYALDNRFQAGTVDQASLAPLARLLGVDTIWVANDLAFDRFRTPRPELVDALFGGPHRPDGLGEPVPYGEPTVNAPDIAMLDEQELIEASIGTPIAPVVLVPVDDPQAVVRVATRTVVLAGSGDGVVDAAAAGLLDGTEAIVYAADLARLAGVGDGAVRADSLLVVTDSNRDRASQWRGSQDVSGLTETGGPSRDSIRDDTSDERLAVFPDEIAAEQTIAVLDGGMEVRATGYGEPFAFRPEDRPAMAVDADLSTAWRVADRSDPVGEQLQLSSTDGTLTLVQQQVPTANRWITQVRVQAGGGTPLVVDLDERSLRSPGQEVATTPRVPVTITITRVAPLAATTPDTGASAVGFAEVGPVALETVRLPTTALDTLTGDRPVAIVLTRDRVRATNRWRDDPERGMSRTFTLPVARSFEATLTLRRNDRAPDPLLDALADASAGEPMPGASSNRRLTGAASATARAAVDGDATTAWTTPFGQAVGSSITVELAAPAAGPLTITQPVDGRHSVISQLTIDTVDGRSVVDLPTPDAAGSSTVTLPSTLPVGPATFTIAGVVSRTTTDRRWAEQVQLPASISELRGVELQPAPVADLNPCRTDLVQLDGSPVGVAITAAHMAELAAGEPVDVDVCLPTSVTLDLSAADHRITTTPGLESGIDVDRITLRSRVEPATTSATTSATSPTLEVHRTRTERSVTVDSCVDGCWLVLGEGYNPAWEASVDGESIGAPVQIAGGFNGWWLPASDTPRDITMEWTPQAALNLALLLALAGVIGCIVLVGADRKVRSRVLPTSAPSSGPTRTRERRRDVLVAGAVLVAASTLVIAPMWGLVAVAPAAVIVLTRRTRPAASAASVAMGVLGVTIAWRQRRERFFPDAAWPGHFEDLHRAGLFVVVLLLVGTLFDPAEPREPTLADADTDGEPTLADADADDGQLSAAATSDPAK